MLEWVRQTTVCRTLIVYFERFKHMNVFSINNRRFMTIDNPPADGGGGSDETENVEAVEASDTDEGVKDIGTLVDAILDAIASLDEKVTVLSDRMDAFVDAGATVRETDEDEPTVEDEVEEDLETAIEDMDFSLDDESNE